MRSIFAVFTSFNYYFMKKSLLFGSITFILGVVGAIGMSALAQTGSISSGPGSPSSGGISPMILNIGPGGNVLMRGEVKGAPTASSLMVKSWGGEWKVNVLVGTQIISLNKSLSDIQDGDFVGVLGTVSSDGTFEVDARIVRKWGKKTDHDRDGISDDQDSDDDNDGVSDVRDSKPHDHDDDGLDDSVDSDDDDDGEEDSQEGRHGDHDNDGIKDSRDLDDDNDGVPDVSDSKPHDNDDDGKDDAEDDDDDNDGKKDDVDEDDDDDGIDDEENDDNSGSGSN